MKTILFNLMIILFVFLGGSCSDLAMGDRHSDNLVLDSANMPTPMSPPPPVADSFQFPVGSEGDLVGYGVDQWFDNPYNDGYCSNDPYFGTPQSCTGNWMYGHDGIDINGDGGGTTDCGDSVYAVANGVVTFSGWIDGWGNQIRIRHDLPDGSSRYSLYGHLESRAVIYDAIVVKGQRIGAIGNGGFSTACHLHFGILTANIAGNGYYYNNMPATHLDPYEFINDHRTIAPTCDTDLARHEVRALQLFGADLYGHYHYEDASQNAVLGHVGPPILNMNNLTALVGMQVGNLNGDAWDDVLHITNEAGTTYFYVRRGNEDDILLTRQTWKTTTRVVNQTFLGDFDGDGRDDLILGLPIVGNKMEWYYCRNEGSKFADNCTFWRANGTADGTFGEVGNVFVAGDFDGNGKVELVRGKKNTAICATGHEWKRLQPNGDRFDLTWNGITCFAPTTKGFFAANVDSDGKDEFVYVRSDDSSVEAYVANFNESTSAMTWALWANDVGGSDGTYFVYDITRDGKADVMLWGNDVLKYSENLGSSFREQSGQLTLGTYPKGGKNTLLFGLFGMHEFYTDPCP